MTKDENNDDVKRRDEEEKTDRQKLLQSFYHLKLTTLVMTVHMTVHMTVRIVYKESLLSTDGE